MKWKGRPENVCESPNEELEVGGWAGDGGGPGQQQDPALDRFCRGGNELPLSSKNLFDFGLPKISSRTLQWGGSCCREGDGAGLDVCCGVLVCL